MRFAAVSKKIFSWMAFFAILMGSVAPAISHALAADSGGNWAEICSVDGARLVRFGAGSDAGKTAPKLPPSHLLEHCPYCTLHTTGFAPAPTLVDALLPSPLSLEVPQRFLSAPRTLHAWRASQPRAPPHLP